jgi:hypothetical protein
MYLLQKFIHTNDQFLLQMDRHTDIQMTVELILKF